MLVLCLLAGHPRGMPCPRCGADVTDPFYWWARLTVMLGLVTVICTIILMAMLLTPPWMVWWPWELTFFMVWAVLLSATLTVLAYRVMRRWRRG